MLRHRRRAAGQLVGGAPCSPSVKRTPLPSTGVVIRVSSTGERPAGGRLTAAPCNAIVRVERECEIILLDGPAADGEHVTDPGA